MTLDLLVETQQLHKLDALAMRNLGMQDGGDTHCLDGGDQSIVEAVRQGEVSLKSCKTVSGEARKSKSKKKVRTGGRRKPAQVHPVIHPDELEELLDVTTTRVRATEGLMGKPLPEEQVLVIVNDVLESRRKSEWCNIGRCSTDLQLHLANTSSFQKLVVLIMTRLQQQKSRGAEENADKGVSGVAAPGLDSEAPSFTNEHVLSVISSPPETQNYGISSNVSLASSEELFGENILRDSTVEYTLEELRDMLTNVVTTHDQDDDESSYSSLPSATDSLFGDHFHSVDMMFERVLELLPPGLGLDTSDRLDSLPDESFNESLTPDTSAVFYEAATFDIEEEEPFAGNCGHDQAYTVSKSIASTYAVLRSSLFGNSSDSDALPSKSISGDTSFSNLLAGAHYLKEVSFSVAAAAKAETSFLTSVFGPSSSSSNSANCCSSEETVVDFDTQPSSSKREHTSLSVSSMTDTDPVSDRPSSTSPKKSLNECNIQGVDPDQMIQDPAASSCGKALKDPHLRSAAPRTWRLRRQVLTKPWKEAVPVPIREIECIGLNVQGGNPDHTIQDPAVHSGEKALPGPSSRSAALRTWLLRPQSPKKPMKEVVNAPVRDTESIHKRIRTVTVMRQESVAPRTTYDIELEADENQILFDAPKKRVPETTSTPDKEASRNGANAIGVMLCHGPDPATAEDNSGISDFGKGDSIKMDNRNNEGNILANVIKQEPDGIRLKADENVEKRIPSDERNTCSTFSNSPIALKRRMPETTSATQPPDMEASRNGTIAVAKIACHGSDPATAEGRLGISDLGTSDSLKMDNRNNKRNFLADVVKQETGALVGWTSFSNSPFDESCNIPSRTVTVERVHDFNPFSSQHENGPRSARGQDTIPKHSENYLQGKTPPSSMKEGKNTPTPIKSNPARKCKDQWGPHPFLKPQRPTEASHLGSTQVKTSNVNNERVRATKEIHPILNRTVLNNPDSETTKSLVGWVKQQALEIVRTPSRRSARSPRTTPTIDYALGAKRAPSLAWEFFHSQDEPSTTPLVASHRIASTTKARAGSTVTKRRRGRNSKMSNDRQSSPSSVGDLSMMHDGRYGFDAETSFPPF